MNKKAFSFVEMIVVISIIILLAVIGATINTNLKTKTLNTRSTADLSTLENSFLAYLEENKKLPTPTGNTNYFKQDTSYSEPNDNPFGVYGQVTSKTLPGKYLNFLPLDQFTGAFYAYGKMVNVTQFEVAGIIRESGRTTSIVKGNYKAESGPYNLIREYNGPNFVYDGSNDYFPYNPDELSLNARITEFSSGVTGYQVNQVLEQGDTLSIPAGEFITIYFGDGSKSVLGDASSPSELTINEMSYPEDGNSLISKVSLALDAGTIWTNATQMGSSSEFSIQTGDTTAAVRGTIFGVSANENIQVVSGTVEKTTQSSPSPVDITSSNSDSVPSIHTEIDKGTGELTPTLKTEVVSYDADTKTVTLKTNNVFKYDAQYLLAGTTEIRNNGSWNIPEQNFDLTSISGDSVTLKFCKEIHGEQVCTRETSIARELSYITDEVTGQQSCDGANGFILNTATNECELAECIITGTNTPGGGWYANPGPTTLTYGEQYSTNSTSPIWVYKKEALPSGNGVKTLKADPECRRIDGGEPTYENQSFLTLAPDYNDKGVKCNSGYQYTANGEECEQVLLACDNVANTTGFTLSAPLESGERETGLTKVEPREINGLTLGQVTTTADLVCNNGVLSAENVNAQPPVCDTSIAYNPSGSSNCNPVVCNASSASVNGYSLSSTLESIDAPVEVSKTSTPVAGYDAPNIQATQSYATVKCVGNTASPSPQGLLTIEQDNSSPSELVCLGNSVAFTNLNGVSGTQCVSGIAGYNLVGFAPYDVSGNLNLYKVGGTKYSISSNYVASGYGSNANNYDINNNLRVVDPSTGNIGYASNSKLVNTIGSYSNFVKSNSFVELNSGEKGIFLDSDEGNFDYLKYSGLSLTSDFIIEMGVKGSALKRPALSSPLNNNTLFNFLASSNKAFLNNSTGKMYFGGWTTINPSSINDNGMYKISFQKEGGSCYVKLNNNNLGSTSCSLVPENSIHIGSNLSNSFHWNSFINYVKIYSK